MSLQVNGGGTGKIRMPNIGQRRSPRCALELPIRVFGTDFQGTDFVEDATTLVVSRHGAKIRLTRKLIPEMEIRILRQDSKREGLFRVIGQAGEPMGEFSFWGVECLEPAENIWELGVAMPASKPGPRPAPPPSPGLAPKPGPSPAALPSPELAPQPGPRSTPLPRPEVAPKPDPRLDAKLSSKDELPVQAWLRCSKCGMRELVEVDKTQIQAMRRLRGLVRGCPACGATGLWRRIGVKSS
jgi:hypothetical protein